MPRHSLFLLAAFLLAFAPAAQAQAAKGLKALSGLIKQNSKAASNTALTPDAAALSNFLKQMKADPTTAYYTPQIRQLQELEILSAAIPPLSSPDYLKTLESEVLAAQKRLERETGYFFSPETAAVYFAKAPNALARESFKNPTREINMAASTDGNFSWGFENLNRVTVAPVKLLRPDLEDYVLRAVTADASFDQFTAFKRIATRAETRHLSVENALQAILYINGASELLDYQFVKTYVRKFNALPGIEGYDAPRFANDAELRRFAMREMTKRVSDASASERIYNAEHMLREFAVYSAFLDPALSEPLALALQTKRYKHALWLLQNPNPVKPQFKKVVSFLENWKNGSREPLYVKTVSEKELVAVKEARRTLLLNRRKTFKEALQNLQRSFAALKNTNPPRSLLTRAEIKANTKVLRLTHLIEETTRQIIRLNTEISALRAELQPRSPEQPRKAQEDVLAKYFK